MARLASAVVLFGAAALAGSILDARAEDPVHVVTFTAGRDSMKVTSPGKARAGDSIRIQIKGCPKALYDVKVRVAFEPVDVGPVEGRNGWMPAVTDSVKADTSWQTLVLPHLTVLKAITKADKLAREESRPYDLKLGDELKDFTKLIGGVDAVGSKPYWEGALAVALGTELKSERRKDLVLAIRDAQDLLAASEADWAVPDTVTMPEGGNLTISVTAKARDKAFPTGTEFGDAWPAKDQPAARSAEAKIVNDSATKQRWSYAVLFSQQTDQSYAVRGGKIATAGDRDTVGYYIGTLYHFSLPGRAASSPFYFSMGLATNTQKLAYFAGPSIQLGAEDAPGYLSIGVCATQVKRLDGVNIGDEAGGTGPVPTKNVFNLGVGVALSHRF